MHEHFERSIATHTPAEAMAFVRGILAHPKDRLRRLIFSDWLEERGGDSNTAWAGYLRGQVELEISATENERSRLQEQCLKLQRSLRATLQLPLSAVAANLETLPFLLPPRNIRIRIGEQTVGTNLIELVPESVARENELFPFAMSAKILAFAAVAPSDDLRDKLAFILNREVILFSGDADDLLQAIDRDYGTSDVESFDSVLPEYFGPPLSDIKSEELNDLFQVCFEKEFHGFTAQRSLFRARVDYFGGPRESQTKSISRTGFKDLLNYLLSFRRNSVEARNHVIERRIQIPMGYRGLQTVDFERDVGGRWYRVTFLDD